MKIKSLLTMTLSLSLVACQMSAPLSPQTNQNASQSMLLPQSNASGQVTARLQSTGKTQELQVKLDHSGFRTQLAQFEQLAFVQVTLMGEGISTPIRQNGDEFLAVTGNTLSTTLSNIPINEGKLRLVQVKGFNLAKQPLDTFRASTWYQSKAGLTTVNLTLNRAQNPLYDLLNSLLSNRPAALVGLNIPALETLLLNDVLQYNAQTDEFGNDPSLFDGAAMAELIIAGGALPSAENLAGERVALQTVTVTLKRENESNIQCSNSLLKNVRFVLNDPLSKPFILAPKSSDQIPISFDGIAPGNWLLSAYGPDGTLLTSTSVVVSNENADVSLTLPADVVKADDSSCIPA